MLAFHNSLTGTLEPFRPLDPTRVRVYACGPTVYDRAHLGNLRAAVAFDLMVRVLRDAYGPQAVVFARNLTDVDDKITTAARTRFPDLPILEALARVTDPAIAQWHADTHALGALPADIEPRATAHIPHMQAMIATLLARGHAYESDGHVFFSVQDAPVLALGALGRRPDSPEDALLFSRTGSQVAKRHPQDFVLWKPSDAAQPAWDSPWGAGRPGWHIECSAMAAHHLGEDFDIHAGGRDLMVPHHANEILQSGCACSGAPRVPAHTWVHTGMLAIDRQKMSKSLGNVVSMATLTGIAPVVVRLALLSARYRAGLDWTPALLAQSDAQWRRLWAVAQHQDPQGPVPEAVRAALYGDLNTPLALSALQAEAETGGQGVAAGLRLMGLLDAQASVALDAETRARIQALVDARSAARAARDWAASDALRDRLAAAGIALRDGAGTHWDILPSFNPQALD